MDAWRAIIGSKRDPIRLPVDSESSWEMVLKQLRYMASISKAIANTLKIEAKYKTYDREVTPDTTIVPKGKKTKPILAGKASSRRHSKPRRPTDYIDSSDSASNTDTDDDEGRNTIIKRTLKLYERA